MRGDAFSWRPCLDQRSAYHRAFPSLAQPLSDMRIPKVWVSADEPTTWPDGSRQVVRAFGWSDGDIAEARARATEAVKRLAERIRAGQEFPERYSYADRPVREEIVPERELSLAADRALVTRNADGCLVLNTA